MFCVKLVANMNGFGTLIAVSFDTPRVAARGASVFLVRRTSFFKKKKKKKKVNIFV